MTIANTPIIYSQDIDVRFGDLDPYGHVNSSVYLDYIISSRWTYLEKNLSLKSSDLIDKGLGFFIINSNINFKRAISGAASIKVESWVSEVSGTKLTVDFSIKKDQSTCSDGKILFAIMDLATMKPQSLPSWANQIFWSQ